MSADLVGRLRELADALYSAGYKDADKERGFDPRATQEWQAFVDAIERPEAHAAIDMLPAAGGQAEMQTAIAGTLLKLSAENKALRAEVEGLRADAARYRELRRGQKWSVIDGIGDTLRAEALDAAIDAATPNTKDQA